MADVDRTDNTEQLQRFINNLWQHQQRNEFCDFTLTTNNNSTGCHKLVLSSASSYFSQLLCDSEHSINIIDVTPLPEHILRTVLAFMYNSEYVIDDENVIEVLKLSRTWNLDILAKLCVAYVNDNITINNACRFYNFALDNDDQHKSQNISEFIRENFISLHQSGQLRELSLKNFTTIIEHDEINVKNEDVIFKTAVQIINQQTSVEDINRCLELIRCPHTSGDFFLKFILNHPLMKKTSRDRYQKEALLYQPNKISILEVKPPRYWERSGIYYIGTDHCMYQYVTKDGNNECVNMMNHPECVDHGSSVTLHRKRVVIVGGWSDGKRPFLLDMTDNTKVTRLPDLPEPRCNTGVVLLDNDAYIVGGYNDTSRFLSTVCHSSLDSDAWQTKKPMSHAVSSPLVVQHQQHIYVLGGYNNGNTSSVAQQYNIEDDTWKRCSDMPVACSSVVAGVVVHEDRIKVFTEDKCWMYADDTDTWTVKHYSRLGDSVKAFVRRGQICAAVRDGHTYSMMSYDDVDNVWKTEHERIDNAWHTWFFC